ncbi:hypothetical protein AVEN_128404-1 [Araneus ventricosus]|uniref:Uncharacterized protein n=1 Tax=Araneus ventricosus TaxID=182803 RepID=A0A4Y2LJ52_ARAVE|nr:hypothetical protein AVEN_270059-1 [Araneus ventricosus]GBN14614.1 hypothetical protein AVEN_18992-1 [Araneus ventricosus]GBN14622.1 hypothetical protein AVEN_70498-1 [Araneus ventricosus]GBN14637.1 hypothetical protein AVEN_128404-1 [Araneus ventricosus]
MTLSNFRHCGNEVRKFATKGWVGTASPTGCPPPLIFPLTFSYASTKTKAFVLLSLGQLGPKVDTDLQFRCKDHVPNVIYIAYCIYVYMRCHTVNRLADWDQNLTNTVVAACSDHGCNDESVVFPGVVMASGTGTWGGVLSSQEL